jgi:hypothetical protein
MEPIKFITNLKSSMGPIKSKSDIFNDPTQRWVCLEAKKKGLERNIKDPVC